APPIIDERAAVDGRDHVAGLDAGRVRGAAGTHGRDARAPVIVLDDEAEHRALAGTEPLQLEILHDRPDRPRGQLRDLACRFLEVPARGLELAPRALELAARLLEPLLALLCRGATRLL